MPLHRLLFGLVAFSAPILAHSFHSLVVMMRGFRLYNSELWVLFVGDDFSDWRIGILFSTLIEAVLTFVVLWFVKNSPEKQRVAWLCCFAFWTYFAFATEVAIK